mmetsp:Transcript_30754/g.61728  ORF Transcript_30754/g.61728 Transcript_30754/m.61728 type:complete len:270 (-) Transcript_30754:214-1023(-)
MLSASPAHEHHAQQPHAPQNGAHGDYNSGRGTMHGYTRGRGREDGQAHPRGGGGGQAQCSSLEQAVPTADDAIPHTACYYWYHRGIIDPTLMVHGAQMYVDRRSRGSSGKLDVPAPPPAWALRPKVTASSGEAHGKWAFELSDPEADWRESKSTLHLRFNVTWPTSIVRVGFMLHCCAYGVAGILLDGKLSARIHASSPGFPHHVMQVAKVGTLAGTGEHTVSVRVVAPGPNASHQFRLTWLHVSSPLSGLLQDSEYKLTSSPTIELLS